MLEQLEGEDARFLAESARAWRSWCGGDRDAVFPYGTLQMVAQQGARYAEAHCDAVLCAAERVPTYWSAGSIADDVERASEASRDELDEVEDLRGAGVEALEPSGDRGSEVADVEHRGLESPIRSAHVAHARRLVILRDQDRRRGPRRPDS